MALIYQKRKKNIVKQAWYAFRSGTWQAAPLEVVEGTSLYSKAVMLLSWNIDFQQPFSQTRLQSALDHIRGIVLQALGEGPVIIFWQEMTLGSIKQIQQTDWIRESFLITDIDGYNWRMGSYGTTALIDKRLAVKDVFRVPWEGSMGRDGLFIDLHPTITVRNKTEEGVIRLCNTHFESLAVEPPVRPLQFQTAVDYLTESHVIASVLAGDFNAIKSYDRNMVSTSEFRDVFLELGGCEDSEEGYTWGQQVPEWVRERYGYCRMDKITVHGGVQGKLFSRFGEDVKIQDMEVVSKLRANGKVEWVSDHFGVMALLEFMPQDVMT